MTEEEFSRFINAKWRNPCDRCESTSWLLLGTKEIILIYSIHLFNSDAERAGEIAYDIVPVSCRNCGNVKTIAKAVVDEWLMNNKTT